MSHVFTPFQEFRCQLEGDLGSIEKTLADMEMQYLQAEFSQPGTVLKGFEGFLSSKETLRKRSRSYKPEDKLFSLSSKSSPVTREVEQSNLDSLEPMTPGGFGKKGYAQKGYAQKGYAQKGYAQKGYAQKDKRGG